MTLEYQDHLAQIDKTKQRIADENYQRARAAADRAAALPKGAPIPIDLLLIFEEANPARAGRKEATIRATFGCSPARYYQQLNTAIDNPQALELNPQLVNRLRARRDR